MEAWVHVVKTNFVSGDGKNLTIFMCMYIEMKNLKLMVLQGLSELHHEKTVFLPMRKHRCRSSAQISLHRYYNSSCMYTRNFKILAFFCGCVGRAQKSQRPVFSHRGSYGVDICHIYTHPVHRLFHELGQDSKLIEKMKTCSSMRQGLTVSCIIRFILVFLYTFTTFFLQYTNFA